MVVAQSKYDNSMKDKITWTHILMKLWNSGRNYVKHDHTRNSNINIPHTIVKKLRANSYDINTKRHHKTINNVVNQV